MTERLTDEQLYAMTVNLTPFKGRAPMSANEHDDGQPDSFEVIERLRARVAMLEAALKEIASRWRFSNSDELGDIAAAALKAW